MSKAKTDWYWYVLTRIRKYPEIKKENKLIAVLQCNAIESELEKLKNDPNEAKYKAINMVLIKKTHTIEGAALNTHYSYEVVKRWVRDFVKAVGRGSGF